jgi:hypothetical protein
MGLENHKGILAVNITILVTVFKKQQRIKCQKYYTFCLPTITCLSPPS